MLLEIVSNLPLNAAARLSLTRRVGKEKRKDDPCEPFVDFVDVDEIDENQERESPELPNQ